MQKKLIAIVVTLAMLLSTFGVVAPVFAGTVGYTVTVDKDEILTAKTTNVKVTIKDAGATNKDPVNWALIEETNEGYEIISSGSTSAGTVTVPINTDLDHNVHYYIVVDDEEIVNNDPETYDDYAEIVTKHDMTLTIPTIKVGDTKTISGTVKDGSGDSLDSGRPTIKIYKAKPDPEDDEKYIPDGAAIASTRASSNGSFALAANFDNAGKYIVKLFEEYEDEEDNAIVYEDFTVGADESLKVTVDKTSVLTGKEVELTITVKDGSKKLGGAVVEISGVRADVPVAADESAIYHTNGLYTYEEDEEGKPIIHKNQQKIYAVTTDNYGEAKIKATFNKTGTATVKAIYEDDIDIDTLDKAKGAFVDSDAIDEFAYYGEGSFKIARPSSFNISVSDTEVDAVKELNLKVDFWDDDGEGLDGENIEKVKVTVEGCGIDTSRDTKDGDKKNSDGDTVIDVENDSITFNDLLPECGGEIIVTAVATMEDGDKITKTETIEVDGWVVTVTPETATYDEEYEFEAVVTKADGSPINNAIVWLKVNGDVWDWDDTFDVDVLLNDYDADEYDDDDEDWVPFKEIDSSSTNINNGTYNKTVRFNEVGTAFVLVTNADGDPKAYVEIDVEGEDVYEVDAPAQLVAGFEEDVEFTVKDEDGAYVKDSNAYVTIDGDDYDLDRDGNVYSFSFVHDEAEELDLVFKTDNGEFIGKTTIEVLAPKLVLPNEDTKLTYMVEENWEVKLVDPRDDSVIEDAYLYITPDNCVLEIDGDLLEDIAVDAEEFEIDMGDGEAEFDILAYEEDDDDEPMLLTFEVEIDDGPRVEVVEIEVADISITASPATIGVDTVSTVTITVLDAHGKPYAGKDVELSGPLTAESETDEDGKVVFKIKPVSTGKITVKVETDVKDEYAEGEIKVSLDAAGAGVITMQLGNKTAVANGSMSTLDVAPFAENGRTLVPFRYIAEAIGAYVEFIAPDKVCYRLRVDENTVDEVWLTIGSTVASVNGVEQTLEVAPKIVDGRTVVPLRFVGEAFGFYVDYNFGTEVITLTK